MEQYRTQLHSLVERAQNAATGNAPAEHKRHKDALPIVVRFGAHVLKVRWNKSQQLWRVLMVRGPIARSFCKDGGYISDSTAVDIAKNIIRAALDTAPTSAE